MILRGQLAELQLMHSAGEPAALPADDASDSPAARAASGALRSATVVGSVSVTQAAKESGRGGLEIRGERLEVLPQAAGRYRISVNGAGEQPSQVAWDQTVLTAPAVYLDQAANRLWIDGAGTLRAQWQPVEENGAGRAPMSVDARWQGGMVFNGRQAYFESAVEVGLTETAETGQVVTEMLAAAVNLSLDRAVVLGDDSADGGTPAAAPRLEQLTLQSRVPEEQRVFRQPPPALDGVQIRRRQSVAGQLTSMQELVFPWGQVNAVTGELRASGPGAMTAWQPGAGLPGGAAEEAGGLTCTGVRYEQEIRGNVHESDLSFVGSVRVVYGPVEGYPMRLDPDDRTTAAGRFRLRSNDLRVAQWQRTAEAAPHVELIAAGQALVEGDRFDALAERISYDQSTALVTLEGDPRNHATLNYQAEPGGARQPLVASKIVYNLRDHTTRVEGFRRGVLSTGSLTPRER